MSRAEPPVTPATSADPPPTMATHISVCVCEHGELLIRLHGKGREVFAIASIGPGVAEQISDCLLRAIEFRAAHAKPARVN